MRYYLYSTALLVLAVSLVILFVGAAKEFYKPNKKTLKKLKEKILEAKKAGRLLAYLDSIPFSEKFIGEKLEVRVHTNFRNCAVIVERISLLDIKVWICTHATEVVAICADPDNSQNFRVV